MKPLSFCLARSWPSPVLAPLFILENLAVPIVSCPIVPLSTSERVLFVLFSFYVLRVHSVVGRCMVDLVFSFLNWNGGISHLYLSP